MVAQNRHAGRVILAFRLRLRPGRGWCSLGSGLEEPHDRDLVLQRGHRGRRGIRGTAGIGVDPKAPAAGGRARDRAGDRRRSVAAGFLQATSLSFVVAAVQIGTLLGVISAATGAALIGADLLSVMLFPLLALMLLGDREQSKTDTNDDARGLHSRPTAS